METTHERTDTASSDPKTRRGLRGFLTQSKTFSAFRVPAYRLLWLSQVCWTTGMQMQMFARGLLAYELGGSAASIGLVSLGQAIPQLIFSMVGGTVADRFERRKVLMLGQALSALTAVVVFLMVRADVMTIPYLFAAGLVQGVLMAFIAPARQAFLGEVVGERDLMNAMALNNAALNLSRIGAPSLAGALVAVAWIDLSGLYFIQASVNVFALTLLFFLPLVTRGRVTAADRAELDGDTAPRRPRRKSGPMLKEVAAGFHYIRSSPILMTLLLLGLVPTMLGMAYQQYLPVFAEEVFGNGEDRNAGALGLMGTVAGVGALIGALTVASLTEFKRRTLLQLAAGLGFGGFLTLFALQSQFGLALVCLMGVGFCSNFFSSLNSTMVMMASDPEYYGRVMSVNMLTFSMQAFGTFIIGFVIDAVGGLDLGPLSLLDAQVTFVAIGLLIMSFILAVTVFNPAYRKLEQDDMRSYGQAAPERAVTA
jgi:MFS family permease